jgi:1,4-alpha-glucan branching enzyme
MRTGALALVLHTHMPYVEGFGTWPFGEEWLWEAMATSYLPLLDVLDDHADRVTLSVTPVLADQLAAPGAMERFEAFVGGVRPASHELDLAAATCAAEVRALEHSRDRYAAALERFRARGRSLLPALARHATWTSAATHAVLPLLATDAGLRLQLDTGIAAHRARFGSWGGGLWLPECAHAGWLDEPLAAAGVRTTVVDWTDVLGRGAHPPRVSPAGVRLVPLDRDAVELVWSPGGYPAHADYRDTHRLTERRHGAWAVGGAPYDPERGLARARAHAAEFVAWVERRVAGGELCAFAVDGELLGHWWHEGVEWLRAVLEACAARGVAVLPLDEAVAAVECVPAPARLPATSWGVGRDLRTWSAPAAGGLAWRQRAAELRALGDRLRPSERALRELLALQSSDWAFLVSAGTAGAYPAERAAGHEAALRAALDGEGDAALRSLAPHLGGPAIRRERLRARDVSVRTMNMMHRLK